MHLTNFLWIRGSVSVQWIYGGVVVKKIYSSPIQSAVCLRDGSGIALVEAYQNAGRNNASIVNADGTERYRLLFPPSEHLGYWFDQVYYVRDELTAFANVGGLDKAYVIDETSGAILRSYESR